MNWAQLPWELKERSQWCLAAPAGLYSAKGKEPLTVDHTGRLHLASSTQPSTWLSFETATAWAQHLGYHIGYMLHEDDAFSCIDLDVKDAENAPDKPEQWTTREEYEIYLSYVSSFDSYTERSASGKGFHIWVRGKIGQGVHRRGVEIYSQERFMISTGDVVNLKGIEHRQDHLTSFSDFHRQKKLGEDVILEELEPIHDDWYIDKMALAAENSEKFLRLWSGDWESITIDTPRYEYAEGGRQQVGTESKPAYPSQSEADLALMSMYTFYSPSNAQCRRLFRNSELGKREKAVKDDRYLNYTLQLIRNRQKAETSANVNQAVEALMTKQQLIDAEVNRLQQQRADPVEVHPLHVPGQLVPVQHVPDTAAALARSAPISAAALAAGSDGVPWPPGVMGRIAQFIYHSSYLSIKEVAIVGAIGVMAGLAGKAWHVTQSGLNQYVTLVGRSGIGKEGMHSGISMLVKAVSKQNPAFSQFFVFDDFASGPALTKFCNSNSSFVNISGEWGKKLKRMADSENGRDQAIESLRQVMTNLYQKSGPQSIVGGLKYSDKDKNTTSVTGVAYSMIGETTPGTFFESLTEGMMEDGFLSRFISIEYKGDRPMPNPNMVLVPDAALMDTLSNIANHAMKVLTFTAQSLQVGRTEDAATIMYHFENECRDEINKSDNESYRQMWNRAALKATRLSALLAVADHHLHSVITEEHITWAIDVVRRDIALMQSRIEEGDIGVTESSRHRKMLAVIRYYLRNPLSPKRQHEEKFRANGVVTRAYLQINCAKSLAFRNFRGGAVQALNLTLQAFSDMGYIAEVEKSKAQKDYSFSGKCYRILSIPDVGEDK